MRELEVTPARARQAERLRDFCGWYAATAVSELQTLYVDAFDFSKQCSLHLTYHVHGDRRQRGMALLRLKEAYRALGLEPPGDRLTDYLPLMLEFAALAPPGRAGLLEQHRVALELVRAGLERAGPVRAAATSVLDALPRLTAVKLARVRRLAAEAPRMRRSGWSRFAPPEVMPLDDPDSARPLVGGGGER